jgi:hypothetical protein
MSCKFICDGCGKEAPGYYNGRDWFKPNSWFAKNIDNENSKSDKLICLTVCSRDCIKKASKKFETDNVIIPI